MGRDAWRIGNIGGIELKVDASWLVVVVLIGYSFYAQVVTLYPDQISEGNAALLAAASAVVFFGSVLLHELAHATMARRRGIPVKGITLFLFGGATEADVESREPKDEFIVTLVGPLTSLAIAAVLAVMANAMGDTADPVPGTLGYLGWINFALAIFNLVPGLPLDGGRLLRAALWSTTGNLARATRIAARGGQIVGWTIAGIGLLNVLAGYIGGLWFVAIGWFLAQAAQMSYAEAIIGRLFDRVEAEAVMTRGLITIPADLPLGEAIDSYFLQHDCSAFPVEHDGDLIGLLSMRRMRQIPAASRDGMRVRDAMTRLDDVQFVAAHTPMRQVMQCFEQSPDARVLVRESDGSIAGIITAHDVTRWVQRVEELDLTEERLRS